MRLRARTFAAIVTVAATGTFAASAAFAQMMEMDDADYAVELWDEMTHASLVGPHAIGAVPYERQGQAHSETLVTLQAVLTVEGHTGIVIVKRSYNDDATRGQIISEPMANLANITVMFQREEGYDPEHDNWFWAMYLPDGTVGMMGDMAAAGRAEGCIGCHSNAPGDDFVFLHDGLAHMMMFIEEHGMMMGEEMMEEEPMLEEGGGMMEEEPMLEEGGGMMEEEPMLEEGGGMMEEGGGM